MSHRDEGSQPVGSKNRVSDHDSDLDMRALGLDMVRTWLCPHVHHYPWYLQRSARERVGTGRG